MTFRIVQKGREPRGRKGRYLGSRRPTLYVEGTDTTLVVPGPMMGRSATKAVKMRRMADFARNIAVMYEATPPTRELVGRMIENEDKVWTVDFYRRDEKVPIVRFIDGPRIHCYTFFRVFL